MAEKQKLADWVKNLGTNKQIGRLLGVSGETARKWILDNRFPSDCLEKLATTLGLHSVSQMKETFEFEVCGSMRQYPNRSANKNLMPLIIAIAGSGLPKLSPAEYETILAMQAEYDQINDGKIMPSEAIRALFAKPAETPPQQ